MLSQAQQYLGDTFSLYEKTGTLDLVQSQSLYTIGSGATNIPKDLLSIKTAELNGNTLQHTKTNKVGITSKEEMNAIEKSTGLPKKLTIYNVNDNRVLEIDSIPEYSYDASSYPESRINYQYAARLDLFDSTAGTANSITFSDYNTATAGYGGSWKIPAEWHSLIIEGALAEIFPDLKGQFIDNARRMQSMVKPKFVRKTLTYSLGFGD